MRNLFSPIIRLGVDHRCIGKPEVCFSFVMVTSGSEKDVGCQVCRPENNCSASPLELQCSFQTLKDITACFLSEPYSRKAFLFGRKGSLLLEIHQTAVRPLGTQPCNTLIPAPRGGHGNGMERQWEWEGAGCPSILWKKAPWVEPALPCASQGQQEKGVQTQTGP